MSTAATSPATPTPAHRVVHRRHWLAWAFGAVALTAIPLWGAVDATLRPSAHWRAAGHSRTRWVALQGIGAPVGIGFVASLLYFFDVRKQVAAVGGSVVLRP